MTDIPDVELDELLRRVENEPESVDADTWLIRDMDAANRTLRQLARLDAKLDEVDATARAEIERTRLWAEEEHRRDKVKRDWLEMRLRAFHEARLAEDPKATTIRLSGGELVSRAGQPRWEFADRAFTEWAEANEREDLLRRGEPKPDKVAVKAAFKVHVAEDGRVVTDDGELVPGVVVFPPERSFTSAPKPIGGPA